MIIPESTKIYGDLNIWTSASISSAGVGSFQNLSLYPNEAKFYSGTELPPNYIGQQMAINDAWKIYGEGTENAGRLVLEVNDDGDELVVIKTRMTYSPYTTNVYQIWHEGNFNPATKSDVGHTHTTFPNLIISDNGTGKNLRIGDDAWIGDINLENTLKIMGVQDESKGYIRIGNDVNALGFNGTYLTYTGPISFGPAGTKSPSTYAKYVFNVGDNDYNGIDIFGERSDKSVFISLGTQSNSNSTWGLQKRDDGAYGTTVGCFSIEDGSSSFVVERFPITVVAGNNGSILLNRNIDVNSGKKISVVKDVNPTSGANPWSDAPILINRASTNGSDNTNVAGIGFHNQGVNASLFYYDPATSQFKYRRHDGGTTQTFWDSGNFTPGNYLLKSDGFGGNDQYEFTLESGSNSGGLCLNLRDDSDGSEYFVVRNNAGNPSIIVKSDRTVNIGYQNYQQVKPILEIADGQYGIGANSGYLDLYSAGGGFRAFSKSGSSDAVLLGNFWHSGQFTQTDIDNWNTAYSSAHNHANKTSIDLINQSLATSASPTFSKINVGIDGISFPNDAFGGGSDTAGLRLTNKGGESQTLEIYTTNDSDDWVNLVVPDINAAKVNGNTIWNAANFIPSNYSLSGHYHQYIVGDRTAPYSSAAPSVWYGEGLYMVRVYEQDYPSTYGNVLSLDGTGRNQIFTGWSGENGGFSGMWIRNKRDAYDGWSSWQKVLDYETDSISIEHWNDSWARTIQSNIGVNCYQANDGDSWQTRMNARGNHFGRYDNAGNGSPRYLNYNMLRETTSTVYGIFGYSSDGEWYVGKANYNAEIANYYKIWTNKDISQSNIDSWNSPGNICLPLSGGTMTGSIAMGSVGNNTSTPAINFNGVIQIDGYKTMLADTSNGTGLNIFANGYERETDGGSNSVTIRNERGPLNLGYSEQPVRLSGTSFTANGSTIWTSANLNVTAGHLSGTTSNLQTQINNINAAMPSTILSTVSNTYLTATGRHLSATIPGNTFDTSIPTQVRVVGNIGVNYVGGSSTIELKLDGNTIFSHGLTAAGDSESDTFEIDFTVRNAGFSSMEVYGLCKMCNTNGTTNSAKMRVVSSSFAMTVSNSCIFDIVSTLSGTATAAITLAKVTRG